MDRSDHIPLVAREFTSSGQPLTHPDIIILDFRGTRVTTLRYPLKRHSPFFKALLSGTSGEHHARVDGYLFFDWDPRAFGDILNFFKGGRPPLLWSQSDGFDYLRYAELRDLADYLEVKVLVEWIDTKQFLGCVEVSDSIELVKLEDCIHANLGIHSGNIRKRFLSVPHQTDDVVRELHVEEFTIDWPI